MVHHLIQQHGVDPAKQSRMGVDVLVKACLAGQAAVVEALVADYRFDPLRVDARDASLLHWAAIGGHSALVDFLVDHHGLDPNHQTVCSIDSLCCRGGGSMYTACLSVSVSQRRWLRRRKKSR